tara:strand:- start:468 stop:1124 length:657 start_codon:yes stop_codon:yes gene_type:complete
MEYIKEIIYQVFFLNADMRLLIVDLFIVSILGLSFQFTFRFLKFEWVKSSYQILNFILLAPIGFVITSSIASNIALSLGMVGALSIIRFRTPVKNSFELVVYFLLLTIGITASVEIVVSIILTIFVHITLAIFSFIKFINPRFQVYEPGFNSDNQNFLTITSKEKIDIGNFQLINLDYKNNLYDYVISGNKDELLEFQENTIENNNEIIEKITSSFYS